MARLSTSPLKPRNQNSLDLVEYQMDQLTVSMPGQYRPPKVLNTQKSSILAKATELLCTVHQDPQSYCCTQKSCVTPCIFRHFSVCRLASNRIPPPFQTISLNLDIVFMVHELVCLHQHSPDEPFRLTPCSR